MRAIRVPSGEQVTFETAPGPVWQSLHEMYLDHEKETVGHLDFATRDLIQYRKNYSMTNPDTTVWHWILVDDGQQAISVDETLFDAADPDSLIGFMYLEMPEVDNTHLAYPLVYIDPAHRRRGYGRAAIEFLGGVSRDRGRDKMEAWTKVPREATGEVLRARKGGGAVPADHYLVAFMTSVGFGLDMIEKASSIDLPAQREVLDSFAKELPDGYTVEVVGDDADVEELAYMWSSFSKDVPSSEGTEPDTFTAAQVTRMTEIQRAKQWVDSTAIIRFEGQPVGYSTVSAKVGGRVGYQEGTWVHADHRGKGLSLQAKVANYLALLESSNVERVETENAEENAAMWSVNDKLGFEISSSEGDWVSRYRDGRWGPA